MRYQLMHTSPYLGGQIRWDIPLYYHYTDGEHHMDTPEVHIVPLNDDITYNEASDRVCLEHSHLDNIKCLYDTIGDDMYSAVGEYTGMHWIYNSGHLVDPYSHMFMMGARRMRYQRYNKQFSFLCPLWISEETDPTKLLFELSVRIKGKERDHIALCAFPLSDALCHYMKEYLYKSSRYAEPDPTGADPGYQGVSSELFNIKFDPDQAYISGVEVNTGRYAVHDVSYIIPTLLSRQVPMMEFDNMLLANFKENRMIAQQLINLNFVFGPEDISFILNEKLEGAVVGFTIRTYYDGVELPLKDLYTNYTDIPIFRSDLNQLSNSGNVCDYIGDNKIIDYVYTNKFTQPIFHWSMVENPGYVYNFYDGFAPAFMDTTGQLYRIEGRYYDQADISQTEVTPYNNGSYWCRFTDITGLSAGNIIALIDNNLNFYSRLIINMDTRIIYLNNNRYDASRIPEQILNDLIGMLDGKDLYIGSFLVDTTVYSGAHDREVVYDDMVLVQFYNDTRQDTSLRYYASALTNDPSASDRNTILDFLRALPDAWIPPYRINFIASTTVSTVPPVSDKHPTEYNMYKDNTYRGYVLRYTGQLCPLFIDPDDDTFYNHPYRYIQWSDITDTNVQEYSTLLKTGYNPTYPSIGYYAFDVDDPVETDSIIRPQWYTSSGWEGDVVWKNDSSIMVFPERWVVSVDNYDISQNGMPNEETLFWGALYNHIQEIRGISGQPSQWYKRWLKELYEVSYRYTYPDDHNVNIISYRAIFTLR